MFGLNIKSKVMTSRELRPILARYCDNVMFRDSEYHVPEDPAYVMKKAPADKFHYSPDESRDCDDAVRIFRGWLSEQNFGNLLAMDCVIWTKKTKFHAVIGFWHEDKLQFGEPQSGKFPVYPGAKVTRIIC